MTMVTCVIISFLPQQGYQLATGQVSPSDIHGAFVEHGKSCGHANDGTTVWNVSIIFVTCFWKLAP